MAGSVAGQFRDPIILITEAQNMAELLMRAAAEPLKAR